MSRAASWTRDEKGALGGDESGSSDDDDDDARARMDIARGSLNRSTATAAHVPDSPIRVRPGGFSSNKLGHNGSIAGQLRRQWGSLSQSAISAGSSDSSNASNGGENMSIAAAAARQKMLKIP